MPLPANGGGKLERAHVPSGQRVLPLKDHPRPQEAAQSIFRVFPPPVIPTCQDLTQSQRVRIFANP